MKHVLTRSIWVIALVSFFTDLASEMLYPIMPLYLESIGFTMVGIGLLEGLAEALVGLSKGYFGQWSDRIGRRIPFIRTGYGLSSIAKPLLGAFTFPIWIVFARILDRFGKGIRTSARDAFLSDNAEREHKGKVFGFHRAIDTLGAAAGPLLALGLLPLVNENYRILFLLAFIPGAIAVALTFFIKDKQSAPKSENRKKRFFSYFSYWSESSGNYKKLLIGLGIFALFNSSDFFLLLMVKAHGFSVREVLILYIFYNLIYALASLPAGLFADRFGMKGIFLIGLLCFITAYIGIALAETFGILLIFFAIYGLFSAFTEGISKAWISLITPPAVTGTAIGLFVSVHSVLLLFASLLTGFLWDTINAPVALLVSASGAGAAAIFILLANPQSNMR